MDVREGKEKVGGGPAHLSSSNYLQFLERGVNTGITYHQKKTGVVEWFPLCVHNSYKMKKNFPVGVLKRGWKIGGKKRSPVVATGPFFGHAP